jgi:hypothetical protein
MYLLATEGWVANMIDTGGFTVVGFSFVGVVLTAFIIAAIFGLNDLHRFGCKGAPWLVALWHAAIFSAFGYWRFGGLGMLPGLACIWSFERGRLQWERSGQIVV